jgi:hippurate hydrolase
MNASTDQFRIHIAGQGGHGARPHETVDAVVVGSHLITALQTIVARETDPADPAVVTIGSFHAGRAANVIAGEAELAGTLRSLLPATRQHLRDALQRMAAATADLFRATITVSFDNGTPPLINTPAMTALVVSAAAEVVGPDRVVGLKSTNMGGEDFAYYLEHVPGGFIRFGAGRPGEIAHPAHSSRFDFDEAALTVGAAWYARMAHVAADYLTATPSAV